MYALIKDDSPLLARIPHKLLHRYASNVLIYTESPIEKSPDVQLMSGTQVSVNGQLLRLEAGTFERAEVPRHIIRFAGPIAQEWLTTLADLNVTLHFYCPPFGACVAIPEAVTNEQLREALPALVAMIPYRLQQCSRGLARQSGFNVQPTDWIDLVCFSTDARDQVVRELAAMGQVPIAATEFKVRVGGDVDLNQLRDIAGVKIADFARSNHLAWAPLQTALGTDAALDGVIDHTVLDGAGQIISVADTGLDSGVADDSLHDDFKGRVRAIFSWPINSSWLGYADQIQADDGAADKNSGHGTHVAGLALGSGERSGNKYSGVAPAAQLVFQSLEQYTVIRADRRNELSSGYYLNGRPMDLFELFSRAHNEGARIHVNAWGDEAAGQYTDDSYEADRFLWKHSDAVILFAAGNSGKDSNGDQVVDECSLYAPASAKNVVAVGATEGPLAGIGYRGTWAGFDPDRKRFTNSSIRNDPVSGQPDMLAMFSSSGPTRDGRIKPDICAPGTNLPAPRSRAAAGQGWGLASPMPHYMYMGGTSMATGVAGGFVALVRQAWQKKLGRDPSGMALKALLVFGCLTVKGRRNGEQEAVHAAGFGRVFLPGSLPSPDVTLLDDADALLQTGQSLHYEFDMTAAGAFKAVLAWYDYPGERLINDLDLTLHCADGTVIYGNHHLNGNVGPDRINTVEKIDLQTLPAGRHYLEVSGANIPAGKQGFALVLNQVLITNAEVDSNGTPAAVVKGLPALPVEWLKGIGGTFDERLHIAGIEMLDQLDTLDSATLQHLLATSANRVEKLQQRFAILRQVRQLPASFSPDMNLAVLLENSKPVAMSQEHWQLWRSLESVFDKNALVQITVSMLLA